MKYQKLVNELNSLFDTATIQRRKHRETLKYYRGQLLAEEKKIHKKLDNKISKARRRKLKRDLGLIKKTYPILN